MALILHYFTEFVYDVVVKQFIRPTSVSKVSFETRSGKSPTLLASTCTQAGLSQCPQRTNKETGK